MKVTDEQITEICKSSLSMALAASTLGIHFNTLKKRAIELDVYLPNPSGKGLKKHKRDGFDKIPLIEIFEKSEPGVVRVNTQRNQTINDVGGVGSGFVFDKKGLYTPSIKITL